jgi:hypothetical protein
MTKSTQSFKINLPIFQWLLLAFLSAGLSNAAFHFQSVRPVSQVESVYSHGLLLTNSSATVRFANSAVANIYQPRALHLQSNKLYYLSQKLDLHCKISFVSYPINNQFLTHFTGIISTRRFLSSPDDIFPAS